MVAIKITIILTYRYSTWVDQSPDLMHSDFVSPNYLLFCPPKTNFAPDLATAIAELAPNQLFLFKNDKFYVSNNQVTITVFS